jgi:hypothetical protein
MGRTKTDSGRVTDSTPIRSRKVRFLNLARATTQNPKRDHNRGFDFSSSKQQDENAGCNSAVLK